MFSTVASRSGGAASSPSLTSQLSAGAPTSPPLCRPIFERAVDGTRRAVGRPDAVLAVDRFLTVDDVGLRETVLPD